MSLSSQLCQSHCDYHQEGAFRHHWETDLYDKKTHFRINCPHFPLPSPKYCLTFELYPVNMTDDHYIYPIRLAQFPRR